MLFRNIFFLLVLFFPYSLFGATITMKAVKEASTLASQSEERFVHDPSIPQRSWATVAKMKVSVADPDGVTIISSLDGKGWSHEGSGNVQGSNFNTFTGFRMFSGDIEGYTGANSPSNLPTWDEISSKPQHFSTGPLSGNLKDWEVEMQATWGGAPDLDSGRYTQTLTVTIVKNS